jgi:hypothetical protein
MKEQNREFRERRKAEFAAQTALLEAFRKRGESVSNNSETNTILIRENTAKEEDPNGPWHKLYDSLLRSKGEKWDFQYEFNQLISDKQLVGLEALREFTQSIQELRDDVYEEIMVQGGKRNE